MAGGVERDGLGFGEERLATGLVFEDEKGNRGFAGEGITLGVERRTLYCPASRPTRKGWLTTTSTGIVTMPRGYGESESMRHSMVAV